MNNHISDVWGWYQRRSPWLKWALFLFVIIAIILLAVVYFFFPNEKGVIVFDSSDPTKKVRLDLEKVNDENLRETQRLDTEVADKILKEEKERKEIEKKRIAVQKELEKSHKEIDDAIDFADVDDAIKGYVSRSRRSRKRQKDDK